MKKRDVSLWHTCDNCGANFGESRRKVESISKLLIRELKKKLVCPKCESGKVKNHFFEIKDKLPF